MGSGETWRDSHGCIGIKDLRLQESLLFKGTKDCANDVSKEESKGVGQRFTISYGSPIQTVMIYIFFLISGIWNYCVRIAITKYITEATD